VAHSRHVRGVLERHTRAHHYRFCFRSHAHCAWNCIRIWSLHCLRPHLGNRWRNTNHLVCCVVAIEHHFSWCVRNGCCTLAHCCCSLCECTWRYEDPRRAACRILRTHTKLVMVTFGFSNGSSLGERRTNWGRRTCQCQRCRESHGIWQWCFALSYSAVSLSSSASSIVATTRQTRRATKTLGIQTGIATVAHTRGNRWRAWHNWRVCNRPMGARACV
jgi:hypothetical protein